jgi:hypothetical protein
MVFLQKGEAFPLPADHGEGLAEGQMLAHIPFGADGARRYLRFRFQKPDGNRGVTQD